MLKAVNNVDKLPEYDFLYCHETLDDFVDPTLFVRRVPHRLTPGSTLRRRNKRTRRREQPDKTADTCATTQLVTQTKPRPKDSGGSKSNKTVQINTPGRVKGNHKASASINSDHADATAVLDANDSDLPDNEHFAPHQQVFIDSTRSPSSAGQHLQDQPSLPPPLLVETNNTALLESIDVLVHDWTSERSQLQLGSLVGSVAWRQHLKRKLYQHPELGRVPQPSALDTLRAIQNIRLDTIVPPETSPLHNMLKHSSRTRPGENDENNQNKKAAAAVVNPQSLPDSSAALPWDSLLQLYQAMIYQDVDEERLGRREREISKSSSQEIVKLMQRLENQCGVLQKQERQLHKQTNACQQHVTRQIELLSENNDTIFTKPQRQRRKQQKCVDFNEKRQNSHDEVDDVLFWHADFSQIMANRRPETAYIVWDDQC